MNRKQSHAAAMEKREKELEAERQVGLAALAKAQKKREAEKKKTQDEIDRRLQKELDRTDIPDLSPEERLLWAIFGGPPPERTDEETADERKIDFDSFVGDMPNATA